MNDAKVELGQIEENDLDLLRDTMNQEWAKYIDVHNFLNLSQTAERFRQIICDPNTYMFSIKILKNGEFAKIIGGFCAITDINWISRHGKMFLIMRDKRGIHKHIGNSDEAKKAFCSLIDFGLNELNLNKVWIEIPQGLEAIETLGSLGFVAEGVRKLAKNIDGKPTSTTICSLLKSERTVEV